MACKGDVFDEKEARNHDRHGTFELFPATRSQAAKKGSNILASKMATPVDLLFAGEDEAREHTACNTESCSQASSKTW